MTYIPDINVTTLVGLTLSSVQNNGDTVVFTSEDDRRFHLYHSQDCCESVTVESVKGDLNHLVGSKILSVDEDITSDGWPADLDKPTYTDSFTWSTFTFKTEKGTTVIRWLGESNGYYSESVSFCEIK